MTLLEYVQGGHHGPTNPTAQAAQSAMQAGSSLPAGSSVGVCATSGTTTWETEGGSGSGCVSRSVDNAVPQDPESTTRPDAEGPGRP